MKCDEVDEAHLNRFTRYAFDPSRKEYCAFVRKAVYRSMMIITVVEQPTIDGRSMDEDCDTIATLNSLREDLLSVAHRTHSFKKSKSDSPGVKTRFDWTQGSANLLKAFCLLIPVIYVRAF